MGLNARDIIVLMIWVGDVRLVVCVLWYEVFTCVLILAGAHVYLGMRIVGMLLQGVI